MAHESALGQTEDPKLVGYTVVQGCPGADGRGRDLQHELNARLASMAYDSALGQTEDPETATMGFIMS